MNRLELRLTEFKSAKIVRDGSNKSKVVLCGWKMRQILPYVEQVSLLEGVTENNYTLRYINALSERFIVALAWRAGYGAH